MTIGLAFLVLFSVGFPVVVAMMLPSIYYILANGFPLDSAAQRLIFSVDSFTLVAIPVFILAGNLMNTAGITSRIFNFANIVVGRVPGGLAQVNIFASLIFAGMSGAALADVGGLGRVEIKALRERGFSAGFAAAVTAASATVGPIFPPSIILIIYGAVTNTSIVSLLLAGVLPAILCVIMLMLTTAILARLRRFPREPRWPTPSEVTHGGAAALPALLAPVFLVGGMLTGWFTPTEAAAVVVLYILLVSALVYRDLSPSHLLTSAVDTVKATGAILVIVAGAQLLGWVFALEQVPQQFASAVLPDTDNTIVLLLVLNLILLVAGMFLDAGVVVLLIMPIVAPPLIAAGVDPVHLGIVSVFNVVLGLVTPPMGLSLFLISDIARVPMSRLVRELLPFYVPLFLTLMLITFIPAISLWLPNLN